MRSRKVKRKGPGNRADACSPERDSAYALFVLHAHRLMLSDQIYSKTKLLQAQRTAARPQIGSHPQRSAHEGSSGSSQAPGVAVELADASGSVIRIRRVMRAGGEKRSRWCWGVKGWARYARRPYLSEMVLPPPVEIELVLRTGGHEQQPAAARIRVAIKMRGLRCGDENEEVGARARRAAAESSHLCLDDEVYSKDGGRLPDSGHDYFPARDARRACADVSRAVCAEGLSSSSQRPQWRWGGEESESTAYAAKDGASGPGARRTYRSSHEVEMRVELEVEAERRGPGCARRRYLESIREDTAFASDTDRAERGSGWVSAHSSFLPRRAHSWLADRRRDCSRRGAYGHRSQIADGPVEVDASPTTSHRPAQECSTDNPHARQQPERAPESRQCVVEASGCGEDTGAGLPRGIYAILRSSPSGPYPLSHRRPTTTGLRPLVRGTIISTRSRATANSRWSLWARWAGGLLWKTRSVPIGGRRRMREVDM
ncbi:hypothetical protein FB451DRAFT_1162391 [Mycena latifolia]|nr:hypothetical protein FB451DRAFT_1162391 [Mycena latifolia]